MPRESKKVPFFSLLGKEFVTVRPEDNGDVLFLVDDRKRFILGHVQDCCEVSYMYDMVGDLKDLEGSPITMAEEVEGESPVDVDMNTIDDHGGDWSQSWFFYKLATVKGYVTIRWYGTTNSCYATNATLFYEE